MASGPAPGMRLDKLSLQFAMNDTGRIGDVLEAYERLILDAMRGDHTLFTTVGGHRAAVGACRRRLLDAPPPVRLYAAGSWGPKSIHQLVAPHAWRLPFERAWRDPGGTERRRHERCHAALRPWAECDCLWGHELRSGSSWLDCDGKLLGACPSGWQVGPVGKNDPDAAFAGPSLRP